MNELRRSNQIGIDDEHRLRGDDGQQLNWNGGR
jgi:hypothetical protein